MYSEIASIGKPAICPAGCPGSMAAEGAAQTLADPAAC